MERIKTITVEGKTYQIYDPEAARTDESRVGQGVWSAKKLIDTLCPGFTAEGDPAVCCPVTGYPLQVTTRIRPVQNGTPSPQNPAPITGHTGGNISVSDLRQYTADFGQTVYQGSYDWHTGLLTLTHKMLTLTGQESAGWKATSTGIYTTSLIKDHDKSTQLVQGRCSHAPNDGERVNRDYMYHASAAVGGVEFRKVATLWGMSGANVEEWVAFLKDQNDAGTPVQILYKLATPVTVQMNPQQILAITGENVIRDTAGAVTVTGKCDLGSLLETAGIQ